MKQTTIRLEDAQVPRLDHHSQRTGAAISVIIRRAIDTELQRLDDEEKRLASPSTTTPDR